MVMTDHYIQRRRPAADLLAPRAEPDSYEYRGEVVPYYPPTLASTPENELYLALAQVQHGADLAGGIPRLERAIEQHRPARPDIYYELARAHAKTSNFAAVIRWCEEALTRDGTFVPALKELAAAAVETGQARRCRAGARKGGCARPERWVRACGPRQRVPATGPCRSGRTRAARRARDRRGSAAGEQHLGPCGAPERRSRAGRGVISARRCASSRTWPRLRTIWPICWRAGAPIRRRRTTSSRRSASDPAYVDAHHSYGVVLALMQSYTRAVAELETAVRLAPDRAPARVDLADVLATLGRVGEARREYTGGDSARSCQSGGPRGPGGAASVESG